MNTGTIRVFVGGSMIFFFFFDRVEYLWSGRSMNFETRIEKRIVFLESGRKYCSVGKYYVGCSVRDGYYRIPGVTL